VLKSVQPIFDPPLVSNARETIGRVHRSFAMLISRLFSGWRLKSPVEATRESSKWDGINQRFIAEWTILI
jgi:hypothetical protein